MVSSYYTLWPPDSKFNIERKIYHWLLAAFSDVKMDNYQLED